MTCPNCNGTDVCDIYKSNKKTCLDCDFVWMPKARKKINRQASRSKHFGNNML